MSWLSLETRAGEPIEAGSRRLTLFSRVLRLQIPGWPDGGLVWNRPVAVLVAEADGQECLLPVRDNTRLAQIGLLAGGLLGGWLIWLAFRRRG